MIVSIKHHLFKEFVVQINGERRSLSVLYDSYKY